MFRSLLSLAAIAAILAATLVFPTESHARRCGMEIPETLLSLYKGSDVIVIATFDRTEDGEVVKSEHYTVVKTKSYYSVATTLKGEQQKMLVLENEDYRYESEGEAEHSEEGEEFEMDESAEVKPGDTVLMFLEKGTEEDGEEGVEKAEKPAGLEPVGYRDGIKKMSGDVLRTYEHRVNQLNVIFNSAGNRDAAIVNWLIDVTEDPITRWEGAFELLQAFQELEWAEAEAKREAEAKKEPAEAVAESDEEEEAAEEAGVAESEEGEIEEEKSSMDRQRYARLITDGHKQALLNILLSSVPVKTEDEKPAVASQGDQVLMQLVKNWGDARLAGFLLDQLRAGAGDSYYRYQLMETIASSLDDKKLASIVEEYGDRLYEEDDTVIEAEDADDTEGDVVIEEPTEAPTEGETVETADGDVVEDDVKKTYGQRRAELIANFIYAADQRITTAAR
jgi:hypothetical protein